MRNHLLHAIFIATALLAASLEPARAQQTIELGRLECFVDAGGSFVLGSTKDVSCVFTAGNVEWGEDNYIGEINRLGIDIGITEEGYMSWLVIAATDREWQPGFLSGTYLGAGAAATVALGLGANVLVGGSDKSFTLQPLSLQAQTGINFAVGIAELELRSIHSSE